MILNISEAAKRVGASRSTLYKMKKHGEISFSVSPEGIQGIDESELARVFPDRYNTPSSTLSKVHKKTRKIGSKTSSSEETAPLLEKIELLQKALTEKTEKELAEMTRRAHNAEDRLDELIKMTQEQSKQLLLMHASEPTSVWTKIKKSLLKS